MSSYCWRMWDGTQDQDPPATPPLAQQSPPRIRRSPANLAALLRVGAMQQMEQQQAKRKEAPEAAAAPKKPAKRQRVAIDLTGSDSEGEEVKDTPESDFRTAAQVWAAQEAALAKEREQIYGGLVTYLLVE